MGNTFECVVTADYFLSRTSIALRSAFNKWELLKQKNIYKAQDTAN